MGLGDIADIGGFLLIGPAADLLAVDFHATLNGLEKAQHGFEKGGFPHAIGAQDAENLPGFTEKETSERTGLWL